jgi:hypothetical protein
MNFNTLKENYIKYNQLVIGGDNVEPFYDDNNTLNAVLGEDNQYQIESSKFYSGYRIPLNTTVFADAVVSRFDNGDTSFFPELSLMFLKTYVKEIFENTQYAIDPKTLVTVFNKNQELVEIPHSVALLLGGLYYFQENNIVIGDLSPSSLFSRINGIKESYPSKEIYDLNDLYRTPGTYRRGLNVPTIGTSGSGTGYEEVIKFPSVRLLNRSLYSSDNETFTIKTGVNNGSDVTKNVTIRTKSTMPASGFGIQTKLLNYYNKR